MLAVSDDGCGMDKQTLVNLFEPFFTTKAVGRGTGLGLATVYGIVKQNEGFINVNSEPGKGSTFTIYLPKYLGPVIEDQMQPIDSVPKGRGEMVLVVEDEPATLKLAERMLSDLGYKVIVAGTPSKAINLVKDLAGEIHLLITDVVMPEMNGRELSEQLRSLYPALKLLFMSGYTADVIAHRGVLEDGVNFIQKPFSKKDLATMVRQTLGGK
jgi:CheY-like chemotaxis protein